jgi:hypothetical protein
MGVSQFTTLEPPQGPKLITAGTYHVKKGYSPKHGRIVPILQDVPGHTMIEMHIGNDAEDTLGCILVGMTGATDWIGYSEVAFEEFMKQTPEEFDLTIVDHVPV